MSNEGNIKRIERKLETANNKLQAAYKKNYYNMTDERRVLGQIESWSLKIDSLEAELIEATK